MKRIIIALLLSVIIVGCTQTIDLRTKCCVECKKAVDDMFERSPQTARTPESVQCGMFGRGESKLTEECVNYFKENPTTYSDCK